MHIPTKVFQGPVDGPEMESAQKELVIDQDVMKLSLNRRVRARCSGTCLWTVSHCGKISKKSNT
jgi:hypothetical protein